MCMHNFMQSFRQIVFIAGLMLCMGLYLPVQAQNNYPYQEAKKPEGTGTKNSPYVIDNIYNLLWIAQQVNTGDELFGQYFVQQKDIDMTPSHSWSDGEGWMPIGGFYHSEGMLKKLGFKGFYDGNGHKITNLKINRPKVTFQALFGYIYVGKVSNLILENADVTGLENVGGITSYMHDAEIVNSQVLQARLKAVDFYAGGIAGYQDKGLIKDCVVNGTVEGQDFVGGIVSWINEGEVKNCIMQGAVKGVSKNEVTARLTGGIACYTLRSKVSSCISYADVSGGEKVGGLIGSISGSEVSQSCVNATVVEGILSVGGLVGDNDNSVVQNCFARLNEVKGSQDVGGLFGRSSYSESRVTDCYAVAKVMAEDESFAGALIGVKSTGVVSGCYWNHEISALDAVGGFYHEDIQCDGKTTQEMKNQSTYVNWDFNNIWMIQADLNDGFPSLRSVNKGASSLDTVKDDAQVQLRLINGAYCLSAQNKIKHVYLYDMAGNVLLHEQVNDNQYVLTSDTPLSGFYILRVFLDNGDILSLKLGSK